MPTSHRENGDYMEYTTMLVRGGEAVGRITLNRPERLNAINAAMPGELAAAVSELNGDSAVRVIVLAGAGRAFCAGYDLDWGTRVEHEVQGSERVWDPVRDYLGMAPTSTASWRCGAAPSL